MTFVRVDLVDGPRGGRRLIVITCDHCYKEVLVKYFEKNLIRAKTKRMFCSKECQKLSQIGGCLKEDNIKLMNEKYGCHPFNFKSSREKCKISLLNGGIEKGRQTLLTKYGVDNPMRVKQFVQEFKNTVNSFNEEIRSKIVEKRKQTCLERYGVNHVMKSKEILNNFDFKGVWKKSHLTKKKNGTYKKSKSECLFHAWLITLFGKTNVFHGELVNDWSIDFCVKIDNISLYFQYDGEYWHGLDNSKQNDGPRSKRIKETYDRDRKQDAWFKENNLILLRPRAKEFEKFIWQLRKLQKKKNN